MAIARTRRPPRVPALLALAAVVALGGCGHSDGGSASDAKVPANAALQVVRDGDMPHLATHGPPTDERTVQDAATVDRDAGSDDDHLAREFRRDGFAAGRSQFYGFGSPQDGGYSTARRFASPAAARRELTASVRTPGVSARPAPGFPGGKLTEGTAAGRVARNLYFVQGPVLYFTGYSAKASREPGRAALLAAGHKVLARIP
jgi:hypothetical protein